MVYHYHIWPNDHEFKINLQKKKKQRKVTNTGHGVLWNHWVLDQMLRVLWFSLLSGIVSQQSPSVCGFLSPLECRVWAEHSWSILITLAGRRWRKKEIDHKGKGRSEKKRERTRGWDIGSARVRERNVGFFFLLASWCPSCCLAVKSRDSMTRVLNVGACWHSNARALLEHQSLSASFTSVWLHTIRHGKQLHYCDQFHQHSVLCPSCVLYIKKVHLHK